MATKHAYQLALVVLLLLGGMAVCVAGIKTCAEVGLPDPHTLERVEQYSVRLGISYPLYMQDTAWLQRIGSPFDKILAEVDAIKAALERVKPKNGKAPGHEWAPIAKVDVLKAALETAKAKNPEDQREASPFDKILAEVDAIKAALERVKPPGAEADAGEPAPQWAPIAEVDALKAALEAAKAENPEDQREGSSLDKILAEVDEIRAALERVKPKSGKGPGHEWAPTVKVDELKAALEAVKTEHPQDLRSKWPRIAKVDALKAALEQADAGGSSDEWLVIATHWAAVVELAHAQPPSKFTLHACTPTPGSSTEIVLYAQHEDDELKLLFDFAPAARPAIGKRFPKEFDIDGAEIVFLHRYQQEIHQLRTRVVWANGPMA